MTPNSARMNGEQKNIKKSSKVTENPKEGTKETQR